MSSNGLASVLSEMDITALLHAGFRPDGIKANIFLFYKISIRTNLSAELRRMIGRCKTLETEEQSIVNRQGYIINSLRRMLDNELEKDS